MQEDAVRVGVHGVVEEEPHSFGLVDWKGHGAVVRAKFLGAIRAAPVRAGRFPG